MNASRWCDAASFWRQDAWPATRPVVQGLATDGCGRGGRARRSPGLVRVGSFYLTPYLRIGTLGVDTNVFYTPTERQTDFTASGGPGLEVVRPFGSRSRLRLDGGLDYVYFAADRVPAAAERLRVGARSTSEA